MTSTEIATALGVEESSDQLRRVCLLLRDGVPEIWTGASGLPESPWQLTISLDRIATYVGVDSIADLLARRRRLE